MSWLVIKLTCKKVWIWFKEHWKIPLLIVWSIFIWVMARKDFNAALKVIEIRKESYEKQIAAIKDAHNKEIIERNNLIKEYDNAISRIKKEFEKKERVLEEKHKRTVREVVARSKKNPEEVRKEIEKVFGFKYVE